MSKKVSRAFGVGVPVLYKGRMLRRCGAFCLVFGLLAGLSGCFLFGAYQLGPAFIPREPSASDWPDVGAVVLEDVATLSFRETELPQKGGRRLAAVMDRRRKLKILRESGLAMATVDLPIDGYSTVTKVLGRSQAPNGGVTNMPGDSLRALARVNETERAPDVKILRFVVPGAEVGGVVEYRYERVFIDPHQVPPFVFGDNLPVLHSEFGLVVSDVVKVDYRYGVGDRMVDRAPIRSTQSGDDDRLVFVEKDLPAFYGEGMMPHITRTGPPWIGVALREQREGSRVQRVNTWGDIAALAWRPLQKVKSPDGHGGNPLAQYQAFRQAVHPVTLPGFGVRQPESGAKLWRGAPACSRDAAALLASLWQSSGLKAYPALLTGMMGPPLSDDFPALYPVVQTVVALEVTPDMLNGQNCADEPLKQGALCGSPPGSFLFVDPLCKLCGFGTLPPELAGGRALLVAEGQSVWADMPLDPPQRNTLQITSRWEMDARGEMHGITQAQATGTVALGLRRALTACKSDIERAALTHQVLLNGDTAATMKGARPLPQDSLEGPTLFEAQVQAQAQRRDFEHFRMRVIDIAGSAIPEGWRGSRRTAAILESPRWLETDMVIQVPAGYTATPRPPFKLSNKWVDYAGGFALNGRNLRFARRFVVKAHVVPPDLWPEFQDVLQAIREFENDGPEVFATE